MISNQGQRPQVANQKSELKIRKSFCATLHFLNLPRHNILKRHNPPFPPP
jgi:hypothetical protein